MDKYERILEGGVNELEEAIRKVMGTHHDLMNGFSELDKDLDYIAMTITNRKLKKMHGPFLNSLSELKSKVDKVQKFLELGKSYWRRRGD
jgi:archaellum component FlaC